MTAKEFREILKDYKDTYIGVIKDKSKYKIVPASLQIEPQNEVFIFNIEPAEECLDEATVSSILGDLNRAFKANYQLKFKIAFGETFDTDKCKMEDNYIRI